LDVEKSAAHSTILPLGLDVLNQPSLHSESNALYLGIDPAILAAFVLEQLISESRNIASTSEFSRLAS
jgi:hypothetical protein